MTLAMLFPGQGSQAVGMLGSHTDPVIAATFSEAGEHLGWDLAKLVAEGPAESLNQTERTQPALLAAGIALWRLWQKQGLAQPVAMAGHSLGEYTALVAAGSLEFGVALKLVELRGQLMQSAVPQGTGGMVAVIGLDDDKVQALCAAYPGSEVLEPVNYNAPGQVVCAGQTAAIDWLAANGKANGARMVMRLPVSVPSHCSLMREAAEKLFDRLGSIDIKAPAVPVLHNFDTQARTSADDIRTALKEQLYKPVQWTSTVRKLSSDGVDTFCECGPGKVLIGLNKRILDGAKSFALEDPAQFSQAAAAAV